MGYRLVDSIQVAGPYVALGASQSAAFSRRWSLLARAAVGVLFARALNNMDGVAFDKAEDVPLGVEGAGEASQAVPVFVDSEALLQWTFRRLRLGVGVRASLVLTAGPQLSDRRLVLPPPPASCFATSGQAPVAACSPTGVSVPDERAHRLFLAAGPALSIGYDF